MNRYLTWALLLTCGWLSATVSGAAGFGGALLLLPVLTLTVGANAAVPTLTVAQLLGNLSRAGFGWRSSSASVPCRGNSVVAGYAGPPGES